MTDACVPSLQQYTSLSLSLSLPYKVRPLRRLFLSHLRPNLPSMARICSGLSLASGNLLIKYSTGFVSIARASTKCWAYRPTRSLKDLRCSPSEGIKSPLRRFIKVVWPRGEEGGEERHIDKHIRGMGPVSKYSPTDVFSQVLLSSGKIPLLFQMYGSDLNFFRFETLEAFSD